MIKLIVTLMTLAISWASAEAQTPHKIQKQQTVSSVNSAVKDSIVAYSDTTSTGTATADTASTQTWEYHTRHDFSEVKDPFQLIAYLTQVSAGGVIVAIFFVIMALLIMFSPFLLIIAILYLIYKRKKQRYRLIEKAMETNQKIPAELFREEGSGTQRLWGKGIINISIGVGIMVFAMILEEEIIAGIAALFFFYGAGQAVIARNSRKKEYTSNDKNDKGNDISDENM